MRHANPYEFQVGELIESVYSGYRYVVLVNDKKGMAVLQNESGGKESWNAYNNPHFKLASPQLKLAL